MKLPDGSYYIPGSGTSGTATRLFSYPAKFSEDQYLANVDYMVSAKNNLQMKYMFTKDPYTYTGQANPAFSELPGRVETDNRSNTSAVLRWTSILTSNFLNEARGSFQRVLQDGTETVPYTAQQVGIKPLIDAACCLGTTGGTYTHPPRMDIGGAFIIGGDRVPQFAPSNQTQWSDQISWTHGKHTVRAGFEYENVRYPLVYAGLGNGSLIVPSFADLLIGRAGCQPADTTCSVANPGNTTGIALSSFANCLFCVRSPVQGIIHSFHLHNVSTFAQDDWKVSSKLTVNLGVRWEYDGELSDKYGNLTNFWASDLRTVPIPPSAPSQTDPNAFIGYVVPSNYDPRPISQGGKGPLPPGIRVFPGETTTQNGVPLNNFAPRLGFAWQMSQRLVVRGGVGMFYDRVGINRLVHAVNEGRPYADTTGIRTKSPVCKVPSRTGRWRSCRGGSISRPSRVRRSTRRSMTSCTRPWCANTIWASSTSSPLPTFWRLASWDRAASTRWITTTTSTRRVLVCTALVTSNCVTGNINGITTNTAANAAARVPYLGYLPSGFQQNGFDGVYNYNSLQSNGSQELVPRAGLPGRLHL